MKRILSLISLLLVCLCVQAQRPKVGVVLCGGGAKGAAHVGVLKVLEEKKIPIDYIAGTSMGSIVGGLYAIGYNADQLDSLISGQDWPYIMSDKVKPKNVSFEDRMYNSKYPIRIPFTIRRGSSRAFSRPVTPDEKPGPLSLLDNMPISYINGQNVYNLFTSLTVGYQDSLDFNRMPIPFACVAVDVAGKREYVWHSGNFVDAIRSSMAIPLAFAPVRIGDMVLCDGGLLNNFPVDIAKSMGADIIIGVLLGREEENSDSGVNNVAQILGNTIDMYMAGKYDDAIRNTDILIRPSTKGFSALSFDAESIRQLLENGRLAAEEKSDALDSLKHYLDSCRTAWESEARGPMAKPVEKYRKAVNLSTDTVTIGSFSFSGISPEKVRHLFSRSKLRSGIRISGKDLEKEIDRFYNTTAFEAVNYRLKGTDEPYDLELIFRQGHNCELNLGAKVDLEEIASIFFDLGINRKVLSGSEFTASGVISTNPKLNLEYSYSFPFPLKFNISYDINYISPNSFSRYDESINYLKNSVYLNMSTRMFSTVQTRFGAAYHNFHTYTAECPVRVEDYDYSFDRENYLNFFFEQNFNSLDDEYFPKRGIEADGSLIFASDWLCPKDKGMSPFGQLYLHVRGAIPLGEKVALVPEIWSGNLFGENIPYLYGNKLGGYVAGRYFHKQIPFNGFLYYRASRKLLEAASLKCNVNVYKRHYLTVSGSFATDGGNLRQLMEPDFSYAAQFGYTFYSPVGPLFFSLHWSNAPLRNPVGVYFSLGFDL